MPDPIMDPATIIVESSRPSPRTNPVVFVCVTAAASAISFSSLPADSFGTACLIRTSQGEIGTRAAIILKCFLLSSVFPSSADAEPLATLWFDTRCVRGEPHCE